MRALAICLALALSLGPAVAQSEPSVRGLITTSAGNPVPGYPVIVEGPNDISHVVLTDRSGRFVLHDLPQGQYTATAANQADRPVPFEVGNGDTLELSAIKLTGY